MSETKESNDTIIVAEDSAPNRKILSHLVKKFGFTVIECADGGDALEALNKTIEEGGSIAAILSDVMMPKLDGLELLEQVRNQDSMKSIPFVLVTAVSDKEQILKAKSLNVNGYILKPVTFERIGKKLKELFPNRELPKLTG